MKLNKISSDTLYPRIPSVILRDNKSGEILNNIDPTHLYISHIHADHMGGTNLFSENMLMVLDKDIPVYIKDFEQKHLFMRLKSFGFVNIIELTPWKATKISQEMEITIFPCDTSNLDSLQDDPKFRKLMK